MKKLLVLMLIPLVAFGLTKATNDRTGSVNVEFDYKIRTGVTTTNLTVIDTALVIGASDTVVTRYYQNFGSDISAQFDLTGGATRDLQIKVQFANTGGSTLADSMFIDHYWINWTGSGPDSARVATVKTDIEIEDNGLTSTILIPPLGADYFRFYIISNATQSGNTKFNAIRMTRRK